MIIVITGAAAIFHGTRTRTAATTLDFAGLFEDFRCPDCNILFITLDTVRADHLSCYGYSKDTSPEICGLAERGVVFENAYSPAPATLPALASIMTGSLVANRNIGNILSHFDRRPTLPTFFAERGYTTAGFTDHAGIGGGSRGSTLPLKGYQTFENLGRDRSTLTSPALTHKVAEWLNKHDKEKFFMWVHYFDPHLNYAPPEELESRFGYSKERCGRAVPNMDITDIRAIEKDFSPQEISCLIALHDSETYYVDSFIGELLDTLQRLGIENRTVVVVSADHGEEFRERTRVGHEWTVYNELIRVPLIVYNPRRSAAVRVDEAIGTQDLYQILPHMVAGNPLAQTREIVSRAYHYYRTDELEPTRPNEYTMISADKKVILTPADGKTEFYDLGKDRAEKTNRSSSPEAAALRGRLERWIRENTVEVPPPRPELLRDYDETNEVLRQLGYVR